MKCFYHPDREALSFCENCGKGICEECSAEVKGKRYCYKCMKDILQEKRKGGDSKQEKKATEKKKKKAPFFLRLITLSMGLGGLAEIIISILMYVSFMSQMLFNPSLLATSGFVNIGLGLTVIFGLMVMIAGKKLKNLEKNGFYLTILLSLATIFASPIIKGPAEGIYPLLLLGFIIADIYLIRNRKLFFGEKVARP